MKKNIIILLFMLLIFNACESEKKNIQIAQNTCSENQIIQKEKIFQYIKNIEKIVKKNGCEIISVYDNIIESKEFSLLKKIENNSTLEKKMFLLLSKENKLFLLMNKDKTIRDTIIRNCLNNHFIENFIYIVDKKIKNEDKYLIEKDTNYLNYFLLASLYSTNKKEAIELYLELKSHISIELIPLFALIVNAIGEDYNFYELIENFSNLQNYLSINSLKELITYPQYFAYFLYPKKEIFYKGTISSYQLKKLQQSIQEKVVFLYEEMIEDNRYLKNINQSEYALLTIQYIYPYLLEQSRVDIDDFKLLFSYLVKKEYIFELFEKDKCSDKTEENFAVFGQNNIENMIKLLKKEKEFTFDLFYKLKDSEKKMTSLFYIANSYKNLTEQEWIIFKNLLETLPNTFMDKLYFIQRIEQSGYFRNISTQKDYDVEIDSKYSKKYKKYKYVLLTSYPLQNDQSLFELSLDKNLTDKVLQQSLVDLIGKNKKSLEKHEFTKGEKIFGNIEKLETVTTVISIGLVPFTGGLSLTTVAFKVVIKKGTKKGAKYIKNKIINLIKKKIKNKENLILKKVEDNMLEKIRKKVKVVNKTAKKIIKKKEKILNFFYPNNFKIKQVCKEIN